MKNPDPDFPDRPQHPDFMAMSEVVRNNDTMLEGEGFNFEQFVNAQIDLDSLMYMARGRVWLAARERNELPSTGVELAEQMSLWLDAFLVGLQLGKERAR